MRLSAVRLTLLLFAGAAIAAPDDLEDAFRNLQQAQSQKDVSLVRKLALETTGLAAKVIAAPAPENESDKEAWSQRVAYARDVKRHTEYALYATAVAAQPPATIELVSTLEEVNPTSTYLDDAYARYFIALTQTGGSAKIFGIAQNAVAHFPENEDLLLVLADTSFGRKQSDAALRYADRLVASLGKHTKPEGMSASDWQRKKSAGLARGYWIAGMVHSERNEYAATDRSFRAALPLIEGDNGLLSAALFHLGVANYQLGRLTNDRGRVLEGAKFSERAAAMTSPYAQQAWRNAAVMKTEAQKMR